jgi:predicted DNA-binding transcriptional regulator AlpA
MVYRLMSVRAFPMSVAITAWAVGWYEHEIDEWVENRRRMERP